MGYNEASTEKQTKFRTKNISQLFGNNIQVKRKKLGLTQNELAELLEIGQQSLSCMERGTIAPKFERLQDFARILKCSIADLFVEDMEENKDLNMQINYLIQDLHPQHQKIVLKLLECSCNELKNYKANF